MDTRSIASTSLVTALSSASLLLGACLGTHSPSSLEVDAEIASVTLAEDCPSTEPGGAFAGDCAEDGCPDLCQQSSLQLRIVASDAGAEVPFEIVSVRVLDPDASLVGTLTARSPRLFADDGYVSWDEMIAPSDTLEVTYDTTAPDWHGSGARLGWGVAYDVEVVVRIDGVERTLRAQAMREPEIVT